MGRDCHAPPPGRGLRRRQAAQRVLDANETDRQTAERHCIWLMTSRPPRRGGRVVAANDKSALLRQHAVGAVAAGAGHEDIKRPSHDREVLDEVVELVHLLIGRVGPISVGEHDCND
jgi:hypothetical protein